jgi:predicted neutral ceramidase superfamily lipid hydrolase
MLAMNERESASNATIYKSDRLKLAVDYLKHLTTLSTGSIVVIAGFIAKSDAGVSNRIAVNGSLIAFVITIIFATIVYTGAMLYFRPGDPDPPDWLVNAMGLFTVMAVLIFLVGIVALALVGILNS